MYFVSILHNMLTCKETHLLVKIRRWPHPQRRRVQMQHNANGTRLFEIHVRDLSGEKNIYSGWKSPCSWSTLPVSRVKYLTWFLWFILSYIRMCTLEYWFVGWVVWFLVKSCKIELWLVCHYLSYLLFVKYNRILEGESVKAQKTPVILDI